MANDRQPPVRYIDRTKAQYEALGYGSYDWAHNEEPSAFATLAKPLPDARVGVIATGGIYAAGQTAFTFKDDVSYRAIASDIDTEQLRATHFAYDLTDARRDINVVFPIDALRAMAADGEIGELAPHLFTCMGGIYSQRRVNAESAPELVDRCKRDAIDAVLLVPV
jgi:D-proline reductase (dithiol) PrdB